MSTVEALPERESFEEIAIEEEWLRLVAQLLRRSRLLEGIRNRRKLMNALLGSELLLYTGIATMCLTAVIAVICVVIFKISKRKLNRILEQEYGTWPR